VGRPFISILSLETLGAKTSILVGDIILVHPRSKYFAFQYRSTYMGLVRSPAGARCDQILMSVVDADVRRHCGAKLDLPEQVFRLLLGPTVQGGDRLLNSRRHRPRNRSNVPAPRLRALRNRGSRLCRPLLPFQHQSQNNTTL
jgi:hypothetical protein